MTEKEVISLRHEFFLIINKKQNTMGNKATKSGINRSKQIDFVSRLTFVRGLKDVPEKFVYIKDKKKKKFKNWSMPLQDGGYIKCRKHDFL